MTLPMIVEGVDVLTIPPTQPDEWAEAIRAAGARVEVPSGNVVTGTYDDRYPGVTHEWRRICRTRAELAEVEDFFTARQGAFSPFWFPVVRRDFRVVSIAGNATVTRAGYADAVHPDPSQRWVYIIGTGTRRFAYKVLSITDHGDGTETLVGSPFLFEDIGSGTLGPGAFASLLVPARLAEDGWAVEFLTPTVAIVTARIVELKEALA